MTVVSPPLMIPEIQVSAWVMVRWLVEDNPAGKATLFIALIEQQVVGMQSLIPYDFIQNGELISTFKSEDTLVDKNLRGKGIFSNLYEMVHAHANGKMIWGLTDKKDILEHVNMPSSRRLTIAISVKRPSIVPDKKGLHRLVAKTMYFTFLYLKSTFRTSMLLLFIHGIQSIFKSWNYTSAYFFIIKR